MLEGHTQEEMNERYLYAQSKMNECRSLGLTETALFYAGQLSVLGLFVDEERLAD